MIQCNPPRHTKQILTEKFWSVVDVLDADSCWEFQGPTIYGYGKFFWYYQTLRAHRVAYELTYGEIPDGLVIMHTCDNRLCCNPKHLHAGTQADNVQDCIDKGRRRYGYVVGEKVNTAKLTPADVVLIRELYATGEHTHRSIGELFGVRHSTIGNVLTGKRWKHIP